MALGQVDTRCQLADELIEAATKKLKANRSMLNRSLRFGRLTWRVTKNGEIEVDLELRI